MLTHLVEGWFIELRLNSKMSVIVRGLFVVVGWLKCSDWEKKQRKNYGASAGWCLGQNGWKRCL